MKRIISIWFLLLFLIANTAFGELLRLPTLIHHYIEHIELDNYSFLDFLNKHYAKTINHPDNHHHDHKKLPFKTVDNHELQIVSFTIQPNLTISKIIPQAVESKKSSHNQKGYSNTYLNCIWQPPRFS